MKLKKLILEMIDDAVTDFLYYDRKECEQLPLGEIEKAIERGDITIKDYKRNE